MRDLTNFLPKHEMPTSTPRPEPTPIVLRSEDHGPFTISVELHGAAWIEVEQRP